MILRPATRGDCLELSATLRECDRQEIAHGSGRNPFVVIWDSVSRSTHSETIEAPSGDIAGIWGVVPLNPDKGAIWMLASPEIEKVSLPFLRACEPRVAAQLEVHTELVCASWRGNLLHHRWLMWLGFAQIGNHGEFHIFNRHV